MGVALGWMALALAVVGAPDSGRGGAPIKYTVRFVEVEGLGWRDAVYARLTPVTRQGSATVWTAPGDVAKRVAACATKTPNGRITQAPTVTAWSGVPAHITTRAHRNLVTQVAWNGDARPAESKPEAISTGSSATMSGRKMDQGVLVQLVLQDSQILAVHSVALTGQKTASSDPATKQAAYRADECEGEASCCEAGKTAKKTDSPKLSFTLTLRGYSYKGITVPSARYMHDDVQYFSTGPDFPWANTQAATQRARMAAREAQGAPASKGTSGVVAASVPASECGAVAACCTADSKGCSAPSVMVEVPEIGSQEIAGEWLIPNDGILLVSFGPHTIADKDGKAVIRERLAIIEADEAAGAIGSVPRQTIWPAPMPVYGPPILPSPVAMMPSPMIVAPAPSVVPAPPVPNPPTMPPVPSHTLPQGYHTDGQAADLPPLPSDEKDDDADDSSESDETRPSPQTKKPQQPGPAKTAKPEPVGDTAMRKAQFSIANFPAIPSVFQPAPAVGLQFLVPIKPISFKLPFNRRLEVEVYGRVVRGPEPARAPADLATKGGATTK